MTIGFASYFPEEALGDYRRASRPKHLAMENLGQSYLEQVFMEKMKEYQEIWEDCIRPDWDGYGAKALSIGDFLDMKSFLRGKPSNISYPDLIPEPNGTMSLEWSQSARDYIIISFDGSGKFEWVARKDNRKKKGAPTPIHDTIEGELKDLLESIGAKDIE